MPRFAASSSRSTRKHQHDPRSSIGAWGRPLSACPAHDRSNGGREVEAGFECASPIKNSGAGAAMMRIETAQRVFLRCWFNLTTTEAGRDALGYYHERRVPNRNVGLGPEHDWSNDAADAFGYMAIAYEEPAVKSAAFRRPSTPRIGSHWSA